jgi:hypothetical protein
MNILRMKVSNQSNPGQRVSRGKQTINAIMTTALPLFLHLSLLASALFQQQWINYSNMGILHRISILIPDIQPKLSPSYLDFNLFVMNDISRSTRSDGYKAWWLDSNVGAGVRMFWCRWPVFGIPIITNISQLPCLQVLQYADEMHHLWMCLIL